MTSNWQGSNSDFPEKNWEEDVSKRWGQICDIFLLFSQFPEENKVKCDSYLRHWIIFSYFIKIAFEMSHCKIGFFR